MLDPRRKDKTPTVIELDEIVIKLARHFGFCYGVENAIEIAYKALKENPDKRIFLLSEMIHNPQVNDDLISKGIRFLFTTYGEELLPLSELTAEDIVVVPAFGTTVELFKHLKDLGVDTKEYNTTCPFVEKVWKRSRDLGERGFSIIIHGKQKHEETRATFSHAVQHAPSLVISGMEEARVLSQFIAGDVSEEEILKAFAGRYSEGFSPTESLARFGVVNQTTMLAEETREIASHLRAALASTFGEEHIADHFADTRDTLCYATSENQQATQALIASGADFAIIVGGYNSSNTSHLVELCAEVMPSYFVKDAEEVVSKTEISHLDIVDWQVKRSNNWYPASQANSKPVLAITAGASCPDSLVCDVIERILKVRGIEFSSFSDAASLLAKRAEEESASKEKSSLQVI